MMVAPENHEDGWMNGASCTAVECYEVPDFQQVLNKTHHTVNVLIYDGFARNELDIIY